MKTLTYLHKCNAGDLICALAGIKEAYRKFGKKAVICQQLDMPGNYMQGLVHSVKDDKGVQVTMNRTMFDMLEPLLLQQEYIEDFQIYTDQKIAIDLDVIREYVDATNPDAPIRIMPPKQFVGIPNGALPGWTMLAYPVMACDISKPWIDVPAGEPLGGKILINRTERYKNDLIKYNWLKDYEGQLVFVGTQQEHVIFCREFGLDFPRLQVDNFLELAQVMQQCHFFLGNQSFAWNLANAMGIPRILEMFALAPNCQPFVGPDNYGSFHQLPIQYFFEELYNKKAVRVDSLKGQESDIALGVEKRN